MIRSMPGQMIHYGDDRGHFIYRVAGVAIVTGRVLVHRIADEPFFCLPGGRVEMGEPAEEALYREMREELGCEVMITRLLWVLDHHFVHNGRIHHELGLYFAMKLPAGIAQTSGEPWTGLELDGTKLHFQWQPVERLGELEFKPSCLIDRIPSPPEWPEYVLHKDGDQGR